VKIDGIFSRAGSVDGTGAINGNDLRSLRRARGLTLAATAQALGRSVGWLSQVERDLSQPSLDDLRAMAALLDVSVGSLKTPRAAPREAGHIVRATARRPIGNREPGLEEALLSPDLSDDFEVVHSTFAPGARLDQPKRRDTQELGFIISGALDLWIDGTAFQVAVGDSFRIKGQPYRWHNPHDAPCVAVWVISPPVY